MPPESNAYDRLRLVVAPTHGESPYEEFDPEPINLDPEPPPQLHEQPFRALGHDHGQFYFLTDRGCQVLTFAGRELARDTVLMQLAPLMWWEQEHPSKTGANLKSAANSLITACYRMGIYDPDRIRGRGAWLDQERSVLHLGDRLLVDGHEAPIALPDSKFVYEAARPLGVTASSPLSTADAHRLVQLCCRFSWERSVSGTLLAGWIAIAPICGALAWRPSIWLTGGSGSGKSTVQNRVIVPALGGSALAVQSKTSEAGIRQALGSDARPVIFDEAEREDQDAARRMQAVLDLARQSSSEGGAEIIKGSANQTGARRFRVRSCFLFSSINVGLEHQADENRITVLALARPRLTGSQFAQLEIDIADLLTPAFAAGLLARSVSLVPTIRANAETFARAVATHLGNRRAGDQLGALLAGAYSLHAVRLITDDEAAEFVARHNWLEAAHTPGEEESDEARLLAHLMQHRVRVGTGNRAPMETTLGLLIEAAMKDEGGIVPHDEAEHVLKQNGIRYQYHPNGFYVANKHPDLATIFRGTPWSAGWNRTLGRLPQATTADNRSIRFGPGVVSKAVFVPADVLGYEHTDKGPASDPP